MIVPAYNTQILNDMLSIQADSKKVTLEKVSNERVRLQKGHKEGASAHREKANYKDLMCVSIVSLRLVLVLARLLVFH